ncbi:hypothetical protein [Streptomyces sp. NPDC052494]|uniref:hypothetical protein n=1 Tax=Streptomyces sp. NPDC052494 TaxID=3365692 RepID=UPI0037CF9612
MTPRLHCSLLSLPADLPLPERLTRIARAGFGDVQILLTLASDPRKAEAKGCSGTVSPGHEVRLVLQILGLELATLGAPTAVGPTKGPGQRQGLLHAAPCLSASGSRRILG